MNSESRLHFEIVRPEKDHEKIVLQLRNDATSLEMSFHKQKKDETSFAYEFKKYFSLPELPPLFVCLDGQKTGFISFRRALGITSQNAKAAEISIVMDPKFRGQGFGSVALSEIIPWLKTRGFDEIIALIKKENTASAKAFLKAGYQKALEFEKVIEDTGEAVLVESFLFVLNPNSKKDAVFIIAEAGSNWKRGSLKQDLESAKELILRASEASCDAVKFQTFRSETTYVQNAGKNKSLADSGFKEDIRELFSSLEMPYEMLKELADYAKSLNIEWMSTPFSLEDFKAIDPLVKRHKIASYEIGHPHLIKLAAKSKKPLILSTGAALEEEIDWAVKLFQDNGGTHLTLLQCTACYPAIPESMNLSVICWLKKRFKVDVGLSDHSLDPILAPVMAVALGASVIEKHFTLDKKAKGPDHPFSLTPDELTQMVKAIREAEKMRGSGYKTVHPSENELRLFAKRGLQAIKDIKPGDTFEEGKNFAILRPGNQPQGIHPRFLENIEGKKSKRVIALGAGIQHGDF